MTWAGNTRTPDQGLPMQAVATLRRRKNHNRAGQAIIFLMMVLVILFFVVLWNFDLHKYLHVKTVSQNGGDAAALAAGRWQGITLNLIGDLNIMQALALGAADTNTAASIVNMQARLSFVGPMIGFMAAQQAAKNNGIYQNDDFTQLLREHADKVRHDYTARTSQGGPMLFPEPYDGCWEDYADMLDLIADDGVAAGPDNARLYGDYTYGHILLMMGFYDAIAGRNWCWFYHNAPDLLEDYTDYTWWPDLPVITGIEYVNSEIFGLGLSRHVTAVSNYVDAGTIRSLAIERRLDGPSPGMETSSVWYCYGQVWEPWLTMITSGNNAFPLTGPIRPKYDYVGADATVRVESHAGRLTPGPGGSTVENTITWTAAAKPFGYLNENDPPHTNILVLPAFHDVRLIPVDASTVPSGGSYNIKWRRHIENHLPLYVSQGTLAGGCRYCQQLQTWEDPVFRSDGASWLDLYSDRCIATSGGGGGGGGGTRRGH